MIREVKYPKWLANVVVVQKKNGKWRVCVDFTDLNKACPKDPFPLPHIDSVVDATAGHELLTFMDASSGFQQIQMEPSDQEDTAFMTPTGLYCYIAMPFGLRNAGATYQRLVNMMFKDQIGQTMEVYIDDMVVKSKKAEDHLRDLEEAFDILDSYNMKLNPSKCHFGVKAGKFLRYMVTQRSIEASPDQIKELVNIKSPANAKDLQRLTGRIAALNRFISKSSKRCKEFYDILRKNKKFEWTEKHESALQALKEYLSSAPTLMKPEKGDVLSLYLVVSSKAVSVVLVKDHEGTQYPVYYVSKSLLDAESRYSHLEKLILALIMASTKLRHYFETHVIVVRTNFPIKNVLRKPEMSGRMAKWAVKLSAHDIRYEPRTAIKSQALADFVADFSSDLQKEAELEVQQLDETKDPWILHTDGSSNVKGTGLGILLKSPQGDIIPHSIACEFQATNDEAEYEALIAGFQIAKHMGIRYLEVPREENKEADALANLGSSLKIPEDISIPIIHILTPAIENQVTMEIEEDSAMIPSEDTQSCSGSWISPIMRYLQHGEIPMGENPRAFRIKVSQFTILKNMLYKRSLAGPYLRCIEDPEVQEVLKDFHEGDCGNHTGGRALFSRILRTGYYWPTMKRDAVEYAKKCDPCQRHSNILHQPAEFLHPIPSSWPFMRWGMDIVGKLPKAPGGKVFMLAMTDYFSKWIEAEAFAQVREKEVISFIKRNIITRFGIPSEIICDNGSQFIGSRTTKFCDSWGIKMITSTPVHPQANG
ncbi:putative nucleotidyltransferase, Ribonuclease H [Helianthus annuus]|nr:putative nucleotidyltransferase, Ribonuclease H [Helianthus annuus]